MGSTIIATLRTKTAYDLVDDGKGKKKPIKIGLAPVQRDGMEYEFTLVLDLSVDGHVATAAKDRTRLFYGKHWVPDEQTGEVLRSWLETGVDLEANSMTLLENLKTRVDAIGNVPHLNNWWRAHVSEITRLMPKYGEEIKSYCAAKKAEILAALKDTKPKPAARTRKGNGALAAAK